MTENKVLFLRHGNKQGTETESSNEDVWDDRELIDAYDAAVELAKEKAMKRIDARNQISAGKSTWKMGDKCRCKYSADELYYEADIIKLLKDNTFCIVKYVGYGNEERVPLSALLTSKGDSERQKQLKQSQNMGEKMVVDDSSEDASENIKNVSSNSFFSNLPGRSAKPRHSAKPPGFSHTPNFNSLPPPSMFIPPPPTPDVFFSGEDSEALSAMLMSWYMSGYHTGYYQGLKHSSNS